MALTFRPLTPAGLELRPGGEAKRDARFSNVDHDAGVAAAEHQGVVQVRHKGRGQAGSDRVWRSLSGDDAGLTGPSRRRRDRRQLGLEARRRCLLEFAEETGSLVV